MESHIQSSWEKPSDLTELPPDFLPSRKEKNYASVITKPYCGIENLINRSSNLYKLKRLVSWLLMFINFLQCRGRKTKSTYSKSLSVFELKKAETVLI